MTTQERLKNYPRHPSMRGEFGYELYKNMSNDQDIWLIVADLGFGLFDPHFEDFPKRTINTGAAEQSAMGVAIGLALEGKKPFVYSITPFLLYRPFETIRNYISHENIAVRLVGAGRDRDYVHDGFSHWSEDAKKVLQTFPNIKTFWPEDKSELPALVEQMVKLDKPQFINLRR